MLPRLFEEAGMRQTEDGSIIVLQGRCVGGSTVHNLCYAFRTPDPILRVWRDEHGAARAPRRRPMAPCFERVEHNLKVKQIREDEVNALNRLIRAGTEKLGWSGFVTKHNREACVQSGYCILGCSYDAKQSMLVTYVPRAASAGARIFSNARAERIDVATAACAASSGASSTTPAAGRVASRCARRSSCCGGRGRVARPAAALAHRESQRPGRPQPAPASVGDGRRASSTSDFAPYRGIPQSYYVDEFIDLEADPHRGYVLMPIAGFPVLTGGNLPGFGREHFRWMKSYARTAGLLVLLHDRSAGRVESGRVVLAPAHPLRLEDEDRKQLAEGLVHCSEVLLARRRARGAGAVLDRPAGAAPRRRPRRDRAARRAPGRDPDRVDAPAVHLPDGRRPADAVVNAWGESHEVAGLFVADMSVFPTSLGAPPQITTAALADRSAHHILERWTEFAA